MKRSLKKKMKRSLKKKKKKKKKKKTGHFMSIFYSIMTCVAARCVQHQELRGLRMEVRVKEGCGQRSIREE